MHRVGPSDVPMKMTNMMIDDDDVDDDDVDDDDDDNDDGDHVDDECNEVMKVMPMMVVTMVVKCRVNDDSEHL